MLAYCVQVSLVYVAGMLAYCVQVPLVYVAGMLAYCVQVPLVYVAGTLAYCVQVPLVYVAGMLAYCVQVPLVYVAGMLAYCHTVSAERNLPLQTIFIETVFALLTFTGPCLANVVQYTSNKMQPYTVYYMWKLLYMFRVLLPPTIRSAYNCIYSVWYL